MEPVLFNDQVTNASQVPLSIHNRAFLYGDGLFETLILKNNTLLFLQDHFERLREGLSCFGMHIPEYLTFEFLHENLSSLCQEQHLSQARIKIICWRESGGLYTPQSNKVNLLAVAVPLPYFEKEKKLVFFYEDIKKGFSKISRFKTLNAAPYILASIKKKELGADDMIILDYHSNLCECTASNIYFIKDSTIFTPHLHTGCIEGIMRKQIIHWSANKHIPLVEGFFNKEDLLSADFVFTSNVSGLSNIKSVESKQFDTASHIFNLIQAAFSH